MLLLVRTLLWLMFFPWPAYFSFNSVTGLWQIQDKSHSRKQGTSSKSDISLSFQAVSNIRGLKRKQTTSPVLYFWCIAFLDILWPYFLLSCKPRTMHLGIPKLNKLVNAYQHLSLTIVKTLAEDFLEEHCVFKEHPLQYVYGAEEGNM